MYKNVELAAGSRPRLIQDAGAGCSQAFHGCWQVRDFQGYVMQPFAAPLDKLRDDRIRRRGLQQSDARLAHGQHRDVHFLFLDDLAQGDPQTELLFVKPQRIIHRRHRNSQMIDAHMGYGGKLPFFALAPGHGLRQILDTFTVLRARHGMESLTMAEAAARQGVEVRPAAGPACWTPGVSA